MRANLPLSLAALLLTSCQRQQPLANLGVAFQRGGTLSAAERQSLAKLHVSFATWYPEFSATWGQGPDFRHVCMHFPWGSVVYPYSVFVFDSIGRVVEENVVDGPSGSTPARLLNLDPFKVAFTGGTLAPGRYFTNGLHFSHDAGLRRAAEYGAELEAVQKSAATGVK